MFCAGLIASEYLKFLHHEVDRPGQGYCDLSLSKKGHAFVDAWLQGDLEGAMNMRFDGGILSASSSAKAN